MGAAGMGLGAAAAALRQQTPSRQKLALAVGLGAVVFAAQAINVPVLPGTSAHLVGGVLLAWALGPSLGAWTMALILAVQAVVLGDGGLAALGANVLNMALLPAGLVAAGRRLQAADREQPSLALRAGVAAAVSVPLAALLIVGETALFRSAAELVAWQDFAARMIGTHLWIGAAEGGLTVALLGALAWLMQSRPATSWKPALASAAAALVLALAIPFSSPLPDGYEASAQAAGLHQLLDE
jgi:cobalt/nickel transport system permease protein